MPDGRFPYSNMEVVLEVAEEGSHVVVVVEEVQGFRLRVALHTLWEAGTRRARSLGRGGSRGMGGGWGRYRDGRRGRLRRG